jgi:hypothetical protein
VRFDRLTVLSLWFDRLTILSLVEGPKEERAGVRGWRTILVTRNPGKSGNEVSRYRGENL